MAIPAFSADKPEHDCMKCHKLTNDEALKIFREDVGIPDAKIIEVRPGPVKGLWEVDLENQGKKSIGYIDFSRQKLIIGNVIQLSTKSNLTEERFYEINRVDTSQIPLDNALVMGDKNAKHKIIVFDDPG